VEKALICPCASGKALNECCRPFIKGLALPKQAESLMRSRYSAYVLGEFQYIYDTYTTDSQKSLSVDDIQASAANTRWCRLEVVNTSNEANEAFVEFIAYYVVDGNAFAMHERSRFLKERQQWLYASGEMLANTGKIDIGRNEKCLCASGKKFKRCCGA